MTNYHSKLEYSRPNLLQVIDKKTCDFIEQLRVAETLTNDLRHVGCNQAVREVFPWSRHNQNR